MKSLKQTISSLFLLILLAACGSGGGDNKNDPLPFPAAPAAGVIGDGHLDEIVDWARNAQGLPAMAVVIAENGQVVEQAATGLRSTLSTEAVTVGDAWHIGSLTKSMTATLAGVLVEMSVLTWETRPLDVWPELETTIHPQLRNITIRHLLSHTSGIQRVNSVASHYGDSAPGTVSEKRRQLAADLLQATPVSAVGVSNYSNGGYIIAGAMMETLMSSSWEALLSDYVFAPLDMRESGFGAPAGAGEFDQPWGHLDRGDRFEAVAPGADADNPQVFGPAGTAHTTLADFTRYMVTHINGFRGIGSIVSADTFKVLHTPVDQGSALGWGVINSTAFPGNTELLHAGSNQRWYAVVRMLPELDAGALFVVNAGGNRADAAIDALDDLVALRYKASQ